MDGGESDAPKALALSLFLPPDFLLGLFPAWRRRQFNETVHRVIKLDRML
jgi:hypothetical protein